MPLADEPFSLPLRVYYEDTDAAGVVYYANYLKFLERARTEYLRTLGFAHHCLVAQNVQLAVRHAEVSYLLPACLDDQLHVVVELASRGRARLVLRQSVWRAETALCQATIVMACVDIHTFRPRRLPKRLYDCLLAPRAAQPESRSARLYRKGEFR